MKLRSEAVKGSDFLDFEEEAFTPQQAAEMRGDTPLITAEYRRLNARQHFERPEWGRQSMKYYTFVRDVCDRYGRKEFLDYGCGKQMLKEALERFGYKVTGYDPAFPELASPPEPHDIVVCTDVLEHIEPELLDNVLKDLHRVTRVVGFFVIATRHSINKMVDGSDPHRIVQPSSWWLEKLEPYFKVSPVKEDEKYWAIMVKPK